MGSFRSDAGRALVVLAAVVSAAAAPETAAQAPASPPRPQKSVRGKLESVDKTQNRIFVKADDGQRLAWRFEAAVIEEASRYKPGDPMIVIYRQITENEKRVTALAFPGTATSPIYLNLTGSRVLVRSAPMVDGVCGQSKDGPTNDATIPSGGLAEVVDACWCCAPDGEGCTPGTKSGLGRAILVQCFE
jgi:Ni/Co efflux regulator RcnB